MNRNVEILEKQERKGLNYFLILTFLLTFLLGIVMYFGKIKDINLSRLAVVQMLIPAFGAMATVLLLKNKEALITKKTYILYLGFTSLYFVYVFLTDFFISLDAEIISLIDNTLLLLFSSLFIVFILIDGKEKRLVSNFKLGPVKKILLVTIIFLGLYYLRNLLLSYFSNDMETFKLGLSSNKQILFLILLLNFPLGFIPFLGEEYGWRYLLQPLMQKKYGMRKGLVFLGIIWGVWHLPLCLFFYAAEGFGFLSLINQIIVCIALGIFFGYAYNKTGSIWAVTILHYLNNNMVLMFTEELDPNIIGGQEFSLGSILLIILVLALCYLPFLFSKYCTDKENRVKTFYERINYIPKEEENEKEN